MLYNGKERYKLMTHFACATIITLLIFLSPNFSIFLNKGFNWKMAMTMTASNNNPTVFFNPTTSKYLVFYDGLTIETIITYKGSIVEEWIQVVSSK